MVKLKISSALFFLSLCSLSTLSACTFNGPHKPISDGGGADKPGGGSGGGGGNGGESGSAVVTYNDVKSIFETRCASCHLMNHKWTLEQSTAESKRAIIKTRVENMSMPLGGSDQAKAMTADERAKIVAWAKGEPVGGKPAVPVTKTPVTTPSGNTPSVNTPATPVQPAKNTKTLFVERCQGCHGEKGMSASPTIPNLAGSDRDYILARLAYFSRPDAKGTMMPETIKALAKEFNLKDDKDKATMDLLNAAADFFSTSKLPVTAAEKAAERAKLSQADATLYQKGLGVVTAGNCVSCHMASEGKPMAGAPMIFSQKYEFMLSRFKDFRVLPTDGAIANPTGDQTMPMVIKEISDEDLNAAAFYLGLTAPEEAPAAP